MPFPNIARKHRVNIRRAFELRRSESSKRQVQAYLDDGKAVLRVLNTIHSLPPESLRLIDFWGDLSLDHGVRQL